MAALHSSVTFQYFHISAVTFDIFKYPSVLVCKVELNRELTILVNISCPFSM